MTRRDWPYWILDDDGAPVPARDVISWGLWFETAERHVADDADEGTGVRVSTVFLGLDHSFGDGPPLLYETLVFGGPLDGTMRRYATRAEALAGHREMVLRAHAAGGSTR